CARRGWLEDAMDYW
nr:immunoglobulin heavy chain junction region [Mus musculus]